MEGYIHVRRKWSLVLISCLFLLLWAGSVERSLSKDGEDSMERREEKIRGFREKRDLFFKEDPNSPLKENVKKKFKGLLYYPVDLKYAVTGAIEKYPTDPKPLYANLPTSKEREKKYVKYGRFKFKLEGKEYLLQIYRPLGGGDFFLPFKDKTSGSETYPEGRYLHIEPMPGGKVLIDFNRASNPFCEYNEKFICPFAPKENWLDIEIRAGEKRYK
jgi:uncharacterized protein (DUF1684 family)